MEEVVLYVHKIQIGVTKEELTRVFSYYGIVKQTDLVHPFDKKLKKKKNYLDAYIYYQHWSPLPEILELHNFNIKKLYTGKSVDLDIFPSIDWEFKKEYMDIVIRKKEIRDKFVVKVFFQKDYLEKLKKDNRKLLSEYWSSYDTDRESEEYLIEKEATLLNKIYEIESNLNLIGLVNPPEFNFIDNHYLLRLEILSYMEKRIESINCELSKKNL